MIVGLDVIGPSLNRGQRDVLTCFVEITQQTGFDVPGLFADVLLRAVRGAPCLLRRVLTPFALPA
jgi:glutathione synthase